MAVKGPLRAKKTEEGSLAIEVTNMTCVNCAGKVTKALSSLNGVLNVNVDVPKKMVFVETDHTIKNEMVLEAIAGAGYSPKLTTEKQ